MHGGQWRYSIIFKRNVAEKASWQPPITEKSCATTCMRWFTTVDLDGRVRLRRLRRRSVAAGRFYELA